MGPSFITLGSAAQALDAGTYRIELNRLATVEPNSHQSW